MTRVQIPSGKLPKNFTEELREISTIFRALYLRWSYIAGFRNLSFSGPWEVPIDLFFSEIE